MDTKRKLIIGGVATVLVIAIMAGFYFMKSKTADQSILESYVQEVSTDDPLDIVLDFYSPWLEAVASTSTDPYTSGFATEKLLSKELRTRLVSTTGHSDTEIDPVLCQTTTPSRVTARIVSNQENEVRVLVLAKEKELTAQSVFTLKRLNGGLFIDSILCSLGEFELPREFSFEKEGFLLKNVPPPLDPQYWHIVFEENGELGHVAPLFFTGTSSCVMSNRIEQACVLAELTEASKVHVFGQMTEQGVDVVRLEFIE